MSAADTVQRTVDALAADPAMDGYEVGYPTWGLGFYTIDIDIAADSTCPKCGVYGREHAGFIAANGSHSWRGFAICSACGWPEEF